MRKPILLGLVSAMVLVVVGALHADDSNELEKKIQAEIGVPVENTRALNCSGAIPLTCGQAYTGTTVGGANNVNTYSCVSWNEGGPEKVFVLTTAGYGTIHATLTGMTVDLDVFILSSCNEATCIAYADASALATCEPAGTYYIVVDGYGTAQGAFTLTITCPTCAEPPVNDLCAGAIKIPPCSPPAINISGTTVGANNDYSPGVYPTSCTGWSAGGSDITYRFEIPGHAVLNLTYTSTADGSFYVVTDCASPSATCVVGADASYTAGIPEVINYTFTSTGLYYLILDNYSGSGTFTLVGALTCPTGANETSWGKVKTLYR